MVQTIFFFSKLSTKREYGSTHLLFQENLTKDNIVKTTSCFSKTLIKTYYGSTHIAFFESFDLIAMWVDPRCFFRKFLPKDNMVQPIWFISYCPFQKF